MWTGAQGKEFIAVVLAALFAAPAAAQADDLRALLAAAGLRPVSPPSPASDFDLPRLDGDRGALSDYLGDWVVLTFWATWCQPCRTEMPSLERLHRQRGEKGLAVLGVSVDTDRAPIRPFVEQLGLSFPIFWDELGEVGATYRATSIPLSYLIDPAGRIVGLSRGARDWSQLTGMLDAAFVAVPPSADTKGVYAAGPVELPSTLSPPTAEVSLSDATPRVGKPFHLDIRLQWAGDFEEYLPHPPKVRLPEGVVQERLTASTSSREGRNVVSYRLALRATQPGTYSLDPVELRYTPRFEATPMASRVAGPTVEVRPRTIVGLRPRTLAWGSSGMAVAGLLGIAAVRRWRGVRPVAAEPDAASYARLRARFDEARAQRLRGDAAGFLRELADIETELREEGEQADSGWQKLIEGARYGGQIPPADELDRIQRRVERRVERLQLDPEGAARRRLRFRSLARPEGDSEEET